MEVVGLCHFFGWVLKGEHTVLFLCLCHLGSKARHKATTHNCDSTEGESDVFLLDIVVRFAPEYIDLFSIDDT